MAQLQWTCQVKAYSPTTRRIVLMLQLMKTRDPPPPGINGTWATLSFSINSTVRPHTACVSFDVFNSCLVVCLKCSFRLPCDSLHEMITYNIPDYKHHQSLSPLLEH